MTFALPHQQEVSGSRSSVFSVKDQVFGFYNTSETKSTSLIKELLCEAAAENMRL